MQIIPAVDVFAGRVVRLTEGDFDKVTDYGDDPVEVASQWVDRGATLVHVVDLDGARLGLRDLQLVDRVVSAGSPVQLGGGIRTAEEASELLGAGVERVVMGTALVWTPDILAGFAEVDRVVAAVDVRGGKATGAGWLDEGRAVDEVLDGLDAVGVGRVLLTAISRDGTMSGPDLELTRRVLDDGRFAVVASGGVGSLDHLMTLAEMGCEACVVGRALYEGRFTLEEAIVAADL